MLYILLGVANHSCRDDKCLVWPDHHLVGTVHISFWQVAISVEMMHISFGVSGLSVETVVDYGHRSVLMCL